MELRKTNYKKLLNEVVLNIDDASSEESNQMKFKIIQVYR